MLSRTLAALLLSALAAFAAPGDDEITKPIYDSAIGWNRGDLVAYMQCYEASPETTFVGSAVAKGTDAVLARYRKAYPTAEKMGQLRFSEVSVRRLAPNLAIVTGRYHLTRTAAAGGDRTGLFSVVMRKSAAGWRIIHDHSS